MLFTILFSAGLLMLQPSQAPVAESALGAPTLTSPPNGATLSTMGLTLQWSNPPGATQYHLQVIPFNNDGPGADLHLGSPDTSFTLPPPPAWYGMLPDMTYTWKVRVSDAASFVALDDASWGPWAQRTFRTPTVSSSTISAVSPPNNSNVSTLTPTLQWSISRTDVFYYEVQVSADPNFGPNAFLYQELRHGGATNPSNSYSIPSSYPLRANTAYYWRVRPRVQGDGQPVEWGPTNTFTTPRPPKIVFNRFCSIWAMNADGSGQMQVSPTDQFCNSQPTWSPNGTKIAFVSNRPGSDIWIMNADGTSLTALLNTSNSGWVENYPNWSPDGSKIVFSSSRAGSGQEIWVVNADGTGVTQLTRLGKDNTHPVWSPDGAKIAFDSNHDGNLFNVWVMNADGSSLINVTPNLPQGDPETWPKFDGRRDPTWSANGTKIAFVISTQIWVVNADGSGSGKTPLVAPSPPANYEPSWSGDGTKIVFVSNRARDRFRDIWVMNADGSGLVQLTNTDQEEADPDWTP